MREENACVMSTVNVAGKSQHRKIYNYLYSVCDIMGEEVTLPQISSKWGKHRWWHSYADSEKEMFRRVVLDSGQDSNHVIQYRYYIKSDEGYEILLSLALDMCNNKHLEYPEILSDIFEHLLLDYNPEKMKQYKSQLRKIQRKLLIYEEYEAAVLLPLLQEKMRETEEILCKMEQEDKSRVLETAFDKFGFCPSETVRDQLFQWVFDRVPVSVFGEVVKKYPEGNSRKLDFGEYMPVINKIQMQNEAVSRGITRLCHATPMENLKSILSTEDGIYAREFLPPQVNASVVDPNRYDQHTECICCSIQYPNYRFMTSEHNADINWVVLLISPSCISDSSTSFCECNAAKDFGAHVGKGRSKFLALFDEVHLRNKRWTTYIPRTENMPSWMPTYDQAEVMPYKNIKKQDIIGIVFRDMNQLKQERRKLVEAGITYPPLIFSPGMFEDARTKYLYDGLLPKEKIVDGGNYHGA